MESKKTSLACATAVALADEGRKVLLVSTDPASNLGQVFGVTIGEHDPIAILGVPGLFALNINPEAAAQAYRDRIVGPVRDVLPAETVKGMEEQLSGTCTPPIQVTHLPTKLPATFTTCVQWEVIRRNSDVLHDLKELGCLCLASIECENQS